MMDNHIHIGQFRDVYYDPVEIIETVMSAGLESVSFSSTTSCEKHILYRKVEKELAELLHRAPYNSETLRPFLWYIPDYIEQNIRIERTLERIPYKGVKIHPLAQRWDFENTRHIETLHALFDYAAGNYLPILIHTGHSGVDSADRFERFFGEYPRAKCVLAHCRPLDITLRMLARYDNVYGDTAFTPEADIQNIIAAGFGSRIITGSDFPITHYFRTTYPPCGETKTVTLGEQYAQDMVSMKLRVLIGGNCTQSVCSGG